MKKVELGFESSCPYTDPCGNSVWVSPSYNRDLGSHETTKPGDILGEKPMGFVHGPLYTSKSAVCPEKWLFQDVLVSQMLLIE